MVFGNEYTGDSGDSSYSVGINDSESAKTAVTLLMESPFHDRMNVQQQLEYVKEFVAIHGTHEEGGIERAIH